MTDENSAFMVLELIQGLGTSLRPNRFLFDLDPMSQRPVLDMIHQYRVLPKEFALVYMTLCALMSV